MRYGILANDVCVNVILAEADFAAEIGAVEIPAGFGIGDRYVDGEWNKGEAAVSSVPTAEDDMAAMLIDLEYRATLLELNSNSMEV